MVSDILRVYSQLKNRNCKIEIAFFFLSHFSGSLEEVEDDKGFGVGSGLDRSHNDPASNDT